VGSPVPNVFSSQVINDPFLETLVSFPISQIVSGGPPKDGIPALTNPSTAASAGFLDSDDLVLGVVINGEAKAYPHNSGTYNQSQYTRYPYGDYRTNDNFLIFGLSPQLAANRNPAAHDFGAKDRVLGVRLNGEAKAYPFDKMGSRTVINDQVGGADIVVMWDQGTHLALPYARQVDGQTLTFEATEGGFPFNLKDIETGTLWNANGVAIEGPLAEAGAHLTQVPAHNSMWFAWVTFWQDTGVWSN
jgi:hypothetical protein